MCPLLAALLLALAARTLILAVARLGGHFLAVAATAADDAILCPVLTLSRARSRAQLLWRRRWQQQQRNSNKKVEKPIDFMMRHDGWPSRQAGTQREMHTADMSERSHVTRVGFLFFSFLFLAAQPPAPRKYREKN